jgi:hypothetical protein
MPRPKQTLRSIYDNAQIGYEDAVRGDGTLPITDANEATKATTLNLTATKTYQFALYCKGCDKVTVNIKGAVTGSPTARIRRLGVDGATSDSTKNQALVLTDATLTTAALTGLKGSEYAVLEIVCTAATNLLDLSGAGAICEYFAS